MPRSARTRGRTRTGRRSSTRRLRSADTATDSPARTSNLKPEFARSYEFGTELGFLNDRLSIDATMYRKQTRDQIVNDIRGSYATGFVLFNLNGAITRNDRRGADATWAPLCGKASRGMSWRTTIAREGKVLALPNALPESYVSDTWLYGNVRNGTAAGLSTRSLTGLFYLRNNQGKLLIDPSTGLPMRSPSLFINARLRSPAQLSRSVSRTLSGSKD